MACACLHVQAVARRAGYHSPSSRDSPEKVYATDVYSESPPRKSSSPATKKRIKHELEADIDVLSSHSSDPDIWDPTGKTPKEIAAWCKEYEGGNRRPSPPTDGQSPSHGDSRYNTSALVLLYCICVFTHLLPAATRAM
jgi:hypothetical protein